MLQSFGYIRRDMHDGNIIIIPCQPPTFLGTEKTVVEARKISKGSDETRRVPIGNTSSITRRVPEWTRSR